MIVAKTKMNSYGMPNCCAKCAFYQPSRYYINRCCITGSKFGSNESSVSKRLVDCPLMEIDNPETQLVYCKDCKYSEEHYYEDIGIKRSCKNVCGGMNSFQRRVADNDYCSFGDPKDPEPQLKPCPFCGSEATIQNLQKYKHQAECPECGARTRFYSNAEMVFEAWNRRAGDTEDERE